MSQELTVIERAVVALGMKERERELLALAENSKSIATITNPAGYQQCHSARMALKSERVEIAKRGKQAREDATAFSKAVIVEEKRLIGLIEPEEFRLAALQKAWDDAREAERREKMEAETKRVAAIQSRIEEIRMAVLRAAGKSSAEIWVLSAELESVAIDESFAEFRDQAQAARVEALARFAEVCAAAEAREAEEARIQAEREELARLREEQARWEAQERARLAEEERTAKAARDAEAARQAEQLRRQREEEAKAAAARQAIIDAENARIRAEQEAERQRIAEESDRLAEERAESERKAREQKEAQEAEARRLTAEREALERREREAREAEERGEREEQEAADRRAQFERIRREGLEAVSKLTAEDIVRWLASEYGCEWAPVAERIASIPHDDWVALSMTEQNEAAA